MSAEVIGKIEYNSTTTGWTGVTFSSIPSQYRTLEIKASLRITAATGQSSPSQFQMPVQINGTNPVRGAVVYNDGNVTATGSNGGAYFTYNSSDSTNFNYFNYIFPQANQSSLNKHCFVNSTGKYTGSLRPGSWGSCRWNVNAAISSIYFGTSTLTLEAGSKIVLLGYL